MILETQRLILRELTAEDLPAVRDTLQNSEVERVYEHAFTDEEARDWLERQMRKRGCTRVEEVFLMLVDEAGTVYLAPRDRGDQGGRAG